MISLEDLIYLTRRGLARFYSSAIEDPNRKVVIFINDWPEDGEETNNFHNILDGRKEELEAGKGWREWYYLDTHAHGEYQNELEDLGMIVINVGHGNLKEAKEKLEEAVEDWQDSEYIKQALADPENQETIPWEQVKKELDELDE